MLRDRAERVVVTASTMAPVGYMFVASIIGVVASEFLMARSGLGY